MNKHEADTAEILKISLINKAISINFIIYFFVHHNTM